MMSRIRDALGCANISSRQFTVVLMTPRARYENIQHPFLDVIETSHWYSVAV